MAELVERGTLACAGHCARYIDIGSSVQWKVGRKCQKNRYMIPIGVLQSADYVRNRPYTFGISSVFLVTDYERVKKAFDLILRTFEVIFDSKEQRVGCCSAS